MTKNINELESQDEIEKIVEKAEEVSKDVKVAKGTAALQQQFEYLIKRVFGEDIDCGYTYKTYNSSVEYSGRYNLGVEWNVYRSRSLFDMLASRGKLVKISPVTSTDSIITTTDSTIGIKGTYQPIEITILDPEAFEKAKLFAAAYKELSGQEVTIIQECNLPQEMNGLVEKFDKVKPERVNSPLETVIKFSDGKEMAVSEEHWTREFDNFIKSIFSKYAVEQDNDNDWDIYKVTGKGFFGGEKTKYVGRITKKDWPGAERWKSGYYSEDSPLFEIEVYDDTITKEALTFVKEIESQLGKKVKVTRTEAK